MISLRKLAPPSILAENSAEWTTEYLRALNGHRAMPNISAWFGHPLVKSQLLAETNGKCAYCESRLLVSDYAHVEHIRPKSRFPEECFNWNNLTLACAKGNISKGDYYDENIPLLNPYQDDVDSRLDSAGPLIRWQAGDNSAELTIRKLKLEGIERLELLLERGRVISEVEGLISRMELMQTGSLCDELRSTVLDYAKPHKPYSFVVSRYLLYRRVE